MLEEKEPIAMSLIRQINDPILHRKPFLIDFYNKAHLEQLHFAIKIMQNNLHGTGGVGIAANQCSRIPNPPQVFIIGTDNVTEAQRRYPDKIIPDELIMVNPTIIGYSSPYYPDTGEGCLSVDSCMRARVLRFNVITIEYFDIFGIKHSQTLQDFTAHIAQHEYDHLQGIVYLQKAICELKKEEIEQLISLINSPPTQASRNIKSPLIVIERDDNNQAVLLLENLKIAINETNIITLHGIKELLYQRLTALD